ncbi:ABC transporter substrate-binding protein [soil metagenome]
MGTPRRTPTLARVTLLIAVLVSACTASSAPSSPSQSSATGSVTLTDDAGREVTLAGPAQRIVSLAPSNTEIVCALDACDRLVGVTDFDNFPTEVVDLPKVVVQTQVDLERLVAAEPDLVLAAGNELTPSSVIERLEDLGVPVLVLYPESLDEVYADIELVGDAIDRRAEANELVDGLRVRVAAVEDAVAGVSAPLTLYEVFHAEGTTYTAGEGSFLASLLALAGAEPVTGDAEGVMGAEELAAADPELILLGTASYDSALADPAAALDAVRARPGWGELAAVRDGNVIPYLADIVTTRPGPRIVDGLEALARAIHPDRFD